MSEFSIIEGKPLPQVPNKSLIVTNGEGTTTFEADPDILRRVIFWIGDAVFAGWYFDPEGKKAYLGYADAAADGSITLKDEGFLEKAWPEVKRRLEFESIEILIRE